MKCNYVTTEDKNRLSKNGIFIKGITFYVKTFFKLVLIILTFLLLLKIMKIDLSSLTDAIISDAYEIRNKGLVFTSFFVVLFGPLIEELGFRFALSFKRVHIFISVSVLSFMFLSLWLGRGFFADILFKALISLLIGSATLLVNQKRYDIVQQKYGLQIIWLTIMLFGFSHIVNYKIENFMQIPIALMMCLPQVLMGIVFTYFRLNLGFLFGLLLHSLINGISFSFSLLVT